ncbi:MAG: hypothetical protein HFI34_02625 [Lachnospiraceae bacterium]|nr:hypothetical protein [Lachnospiraceae bacterium]
MVSSGIASANGLTAGLNAKVSAKSKSSSSQDFDSFLKTESLEHIDSRVEQSSDNGRKENLDSVTEDASSKEYNTLESTEKSDLTQGSENDSISGTTEITESVTQTEEEPEIPEEIIQAMNVLFADILQVIVDFTGKTPEEIAGLMQDLGLEDTDLLSSERLNDLITGLMGKDNVMELLTDPNLSSMIKNLVSEVNDLKNQFTDEFHMRPETVPLRFEEAPVLQELSKPELQQSMEENILPSELPDVEEPEMKQNAVLSSDVKESLDSKQEETGSLKPDDEVFVRDNRMTEQTNQNPDSALNGEKKESGNNADTDLPRNGVVMMSDMLEEIKNIVSESLPEDTGESAAGRIVNQILDDIRMYAKPDMTSLEMQLEPEHLGKVTISIVTKAGHITAQIAAQNEVAKEAIESQLNLLKDNLNHQGIKVEAIEVTIASHGFEENLEKGGDSAGEQKESKSKRTISAKELAEINGEMSEEQTDEETVMEQIGATVSYLA